MTTKPTKPGMEESERQYKAEDDDAFTEAHMESWLERNADALNASIREAREQLARGEGYTLEETMARVKDAIRRAVQKN